MTDIYAGQHNGMTGPLVRGFPITPNDSADLVNVTRQIYAGTAGNIAVVWIDGAQTIEPVAAGERLDWRIRRVLATGTTATGLRGFV
jgi:hypothetical protein